MGSLPRKGIKAMEDGAAVKELKDSGAIILCVTTTPELCLSWETHSLVTGITNNSYNNHRTSGGSSGGEVSYVYNHLDFTILGISYRMIVIGCYTVIGIYRTIC